MAIDGAEKRRNISGVAFLPLIPGVTPFAAEDAEWRLQSGWAYAGGSVPPPPLLTVPHSLPFLASMGSMMAR